MTWHGGSARCHDASGSSFILIPHPSDQPAAALPIGSAAAQGFDHEHQAWTALLKKHVVLIDGGKASQVRYAELARRTARS